MAISLQLTRASAEYTALQKKHEMRQALDFMTWLDTLELSIVDQEGVLDAGVASRISKLETRPAVFLAILAWATNAYPEGEAHAYDRTRRAVTWAIVEMLAERETEDSKMGLDQIKNVIQPHDGNLALWKFLLSEAKKKKAGN